MQINPHPNIVSWYVTDAPTGRRRFGLLLAGWDDDGQPLVLSKLGFIVHARRPADETPHTVWEGISGHQRGTWDPS